MRHRLALAVALLLVLASCGVSRESASDGADTDTDAVVDGGAAASSDEETTDPSLDADAGSEGDTTSAADPNRPEAGATAATLVFEDGSSTELTFGSLDDVIVPTQGNADFVNLVFEGVPPEDFDTTVLFQSILGQVITNELTEVQAATSDADRDEAKSRLLLQLQGVLASSPDPEADFERLYAEVPYLPFFADLQAGQIALSNRLADAAGPGEGNPCVRHILVETEGEAQTVLTDLDGGADFATLAAERSTGPSGPAGGDIGCEPASRYVPEFAAAVTDAPVAEYLGPVQTEFGWHVIVVDSYLVDGDELARARVEEGLAAATITVDEYFGRWDSDLQTIVPPGS